MKEFKSLDEARQEIDALHKRVKELEADNQRLHEMLVEVEVQASRAEDAEEERDELRAALKLMEHKLITCGVAAEHSDANLSRTGPYIEKWDSPQAQRVRELRDQRDELRTKNIRLSEELEFERGMQCDDEHWEALRKQREELRQERDELQKELERLREQTHLANIDAANELAENDALRQEIAQLNEKNATLELALVTACNEHRDRVAENDELLRKLEKVRKVLDSSLADLDPIIEAALEIIDDET